MNISTRPDRNAVSGPSRDATDVEVAAIKVPVVSCKTAFSCLDRVCGIDGKRMKTALRWVEDIDERVLPLDEFFVAYRKTALQPGEILKSIVIPRPQPGSQTRRRGAAC